MTETVTVREDDLRLLMEYAGMDIPVEDGEHQVNIVLARCAEALDKDSSEEESGTAPEPSLPDGQWLEITFFGRLEHTGYVTEITRNGQAAYHIDLPEKVWGGNPLAWVEYAASSWFSERPVNPESVRKAWEAKQEAARARREREAEWARRAAERALPPGDAGGDAENDLDWRERDGGPF